MAKCGHSTATEDRAMAIRRINAILGMEYLDRLPTAVPPGKALVHSAARPTRHLGSRGFRVWLVDTADKRHTSRVACDCGFAPELGTHYRMPPSCPLSRPATSRWW
jgi:hypothetical protein